MKQNSFLIWLLYLMRFCKWLHFIHKFWYFHFQQRLRAISNICSFLVPNITCSQWRFQGFGQFWWRSLGLFFIVSLWVALSEEEIFLLMTWVGTKYQDDEFVVDQWDPASVECPVLLTSVTPSSHIPSSICCKSRPFVCGCEVQMVERKMKRIYAIQVHNATLFITSTCTL